MKSFIKPAVIFAVLAAVFTFASCEADMKTDNPVMYTVTFDGNGAVPAFNEKLSVKSGDYLPIPELIPEKTGYDFSGWYIDDVKADSETKITKNTTVTVHWTAHEYTITYAGLEDAENPNTVTTYTIESEEIPLLDATKNGCTFGGWKNGDEFVTEIAKGTTGDITLTALWDIIKLKVRFDADNGDEVSEVEVEYGTNVTEPAEPEKYTYNFEGWYKGETKFDFTTSVTEALELKAKWSPVPVTGVTLNKTKLSLITGDTETLTATILPENAFDKTVTWTSSDTSVATVEDGVVTAVGKGEAEITAAGGGKSRVCTIKVWEIISFGSWPQTIKAADVTITGETKTAGMFTYYKGSDGEWYVKTAENAYESGYTYSDGTAVAQGGTSEKYFKVESIKWRVLTDNYSGKKLLLAESILVNCAYYDYFNSKRTISGKTVYSNNYEHSRVRAYLNGLSYNKAGDSNEEFYGKGFLQTAFTVRERGQVIATTTVDNSARSTNTDANAAQWNNGENPYACNNTTDKIFLLSMQDVTTVSYGFDSDPYAYKGDGTHTESTRIRVATDFAKACGAQQSTTAGYAGPWWLRSPLCSDGNLARGVVSDGGADLDNGVVADDDGVVPALCLE